MFSSDNHNFNHFPKTHTHTTRGGLHIAHLAILSKILVSGWGHLKCWREPGFEWGKFHGRCLEWWLCFAVNKNPQQIFLFLVCLLFCSTLGTSRKLGVRSAQGLEVQFSSLTFPFVVFCFSVLNSAADDNTFFGSRLPLGLSRGTCERLVLDTALLFTQCELACLGLCWRAELAVCKSTPGEEN